MWASQMLLGVALWTLLMQNGASTAFVTATAPGMLSHRCVAHERGGASRRARAGFRGPVCQTPSGENIARATMLGVAAMYGTNFGSVKILEEAMPASVAAAIRFTIAATVLAPLLKGLKREVVVPSLEVGLLTGAGYYAQGISLTSGGADASTAAFLCSLAVVVCPLMDWIQGTRALGRKEVACVGIAVAGTAILELGGTVPSAADLWAMAQPLCFGVGFWKVEQLMRRHPNQANAITALQVQAVAFLAILWAAIDVSHAGSDFTGVSAATASLSDALASDPRLVPALIWTSCFTTALTVWLETKALGKLSAAETSLLFSTEPLWGTAFAAAVLGEHIHLSTMVGGALILAACILRQTPEVTGFESAPAPPALKARKVEATAVPTAEDDPHSQPHKPAGYDPVCERTPGSPRVRPSKADFKLAGFAALLAEFVGTLT